MIVTCPECATRYRVTGDALDAPHGRRVRCARCGHVWLHRPEPPGDPPPLRAVPPMLPAERRRGRGMRRMAAALLVVVVLLSGLLAAGYLARDQIAAAWPAAAHLLDALGIGSGAKGA